MANDENDDTGAGARQPPAPAAEAPTATPGKPRGPAPGLAEELGDEAGQGPAADEADGDDGRSGDGLPGAAGGGLLGG